MQQHLIEILLVALYVLLTYISGPQIIKLFLCTDTAAL